MTDLIEDYLREVDRTLRADPARKGQIITELRTHLREKVEDELRANPEREPREVAREILRDFGNPHDLALAYTPEGTVLKTSTGETVLRFSRDFGRAVGRGTKKVLKFAGISLLVLLVVAAGVGVWAYYEVLPIVEKNVPYPVYEFSEDCREKTCSVTPVEQTFYVHENAREVRLDLHVSHREPSAGTVKVVIKDPDGNTKYERSFPATTSRSVRENLQWAGTPGDWTITYEYTAFLGHLDIEVYAIGLPPDVR